MATKDKRTVVINRKPVNKGTEASVSQQQAKQTSGTQGIILASAQESDSDPYKAELRQKGYSILSENEYGVIARKAQGKPTFMARTANGYFETGKPSNIFLPESINIAMKKHIAGSITAQQYIIQLIMKDLKENGLL